MVAAAGRRAVPARLRPHRLHLQPLQRGDTDLCVCAARRRRPGLQHGAAGGAVLRGRRLPARVRHPGLQAAAGAVRHAAARAPGAAALRGRVAAAARRVARDAPRGRRDGGGLHRRRGARGRGHRHLHLLHGAGQRGGAAGAAGRRQRDGPGGRCLCARRRAGGRRLCLGAHPGHAPPGPPIHRVFRHVRLLSRDGRSVRAAPPAARPRRPLMGSRDAANIALHVPPPSRPIC
mmetsp:Transcript_7742/g.19890  ORF Transcript_7742/g.19890 Transcript_7742/m.19890 type:complete len:233 (+) Transcript_7742:642-1340(+)